MSDWITKEETWKLDWGTVRQHSVDSDGVCYHFSEGRLLVRTYGPDVLRLTWLAHDAIERPSKAVIMSPTGLLSAVTNTGLHAGNLRLEIDGETGAVTINGPDGVILGSQGGMASDRHSLTIKFDLPAGEHCYGLGEKTGQLDKRGRRYQMWNTDDPIHTPDKDPLYQSIPFLIRFDGRLSSGIFLDSTARSLFDLGFTADQTLELSAYEHTMDLYVINGGLGGPASVIAAYATLTGTMKLPPLWALGFQQCRWSYYPEARVMELSREFRERDIPCDVIYLDIDYMDGYRVFTWNRERFPDPAAMGERLRGMGFHLVTIVDPGVKKDSRYQVYVDGCRQGVFCTLPTGEIYHGQVWPGDAAYPDFSAAKTRDWWAGLHRNLFDFGVDGIWNDMNEPSDFRPDTAGDRTKATVPEDVMLQEDGLPRSFAEGHNAYGFDMCRSTVEAFGKLKPGTRPFILTRSGYAGIQRYAAVWTGDNHSWWEHLAGSLPMLLNLGLSGVPFCGGDAGGFQGECGAELYARWMQCAAFSPFFRAHSAIHTKPHEPWAFGPETEAIVRQAIKRRYQLMPYLYSEMRRASVDGQPILRPLVHEWPGDPVVRTLADQFLFGPSLLVAPIMQAGKRERLVYLPAGLWYDYHSGEPLSGGRHLIAFAPLDTIPMYVRAGAVIPTMREAAHTAALDQGKIVIQAWAGAEGSFDLYQDDGLTTAYQQGAYNLTRVRLEDGEAPRISLERLHQGWTGGCDQPEIRIIGPGR